MNQVNPDVVKVHWTHKAKIKRLYEKDGFTHEELAIMYRLPYWYIKSITYGLKRPERI